MTKLDMKFAKIKSFSLPKKQKNRMKYKFYEICPKVCVHLQRKYRHHMMNDNNKTRWFRVNDATVCILAVIIIIVVIVVRRLCKLTTTRKEKPLKTLILTLVDVYSQYKYHECPNTYILNKFLWWKYWWCDSQWKRYSKSSTIFQLNAIQRIYTIRSISVWWEIVFLFDLLFGTHFATHFATHSYCYISHM